MFLRLLLPGVALFASALGGDSDITRGLLVGGALAETILLAMLLTKENTARQLALVACIGSFIGLIAIGLVGSKTGVVAFATAVLAFSLEWAMCDTSAMREG